MNRIIILITGVLLFSQIALAQPPIYPGDKNWQLHWEDDFNFLNTNIWEVRNNHDSYGYPCVNLAANVSIDNDILLSLQGLAYLFR